MSHNINKDEQEAWAKDWMEEGRVFGEKQVRMIKIHIP